MKDREDISWFSYSFS